MVIPLLLPVVVLVALTIHDLARRPILRRLALRNAARRPGEAALVLIGSLLGTAIITASFLVGDSLGASLRDFARTQLGPVDEAVALTDLSRADAVERALSSPPLPGTDGVLKLVRVQASAVSLGRDARAEPHAAILEVDFDAARRFGGDAQATGFSDAGSSPAADEAVVTDVLARALRLEPGEQFAVHVHGARHVLRARQVVGELGVAGFRPAEFTTDSPNVLVAPGTVARLTAGAPPGAAPPVAWVLVSNEGGVFDGADRTEAVAGEIRRRLAGTTGADVLELKQDALESADRNAEEFTGLFGGIGAFSVIAGILLLVNVFVMLADERKSELGMLRALGLRRNQLVRAFGIEGGLYATVASMLGAVLGIVVGRVIVVVAERIFNDPASDFRLSLRFSVEPSSLLTGFLIGAAISLLTVWAASLRIGRLNVIRAIRDLPEPETTRRRARTAIAGAAGVVVGGLLTVDGLADAAWFGTLAGPPLVAVSTIPLLGRFLARQAVTSAACVVSLVWGSVCFSIAPEAFQEADVAAFVVQGVILVASAVALLGVNAGIAVRLVQRLSVSNRALAARLGLAYPLARRFRTAMLLGMYALVVFTLTFLAVFSNLFKQQAPRFTAELRAGHDLVVDSNPGNPVPTELLKSQPEVASAAPLLRAFPKWSVGDDEPRPWPLAAFDGELLEHGVPVLEERLARFGSDRAVFEAVLADPTLVVVNDFFLSEGGGPPQSGLDPGDQVTLHNATTGERRVLTVAGEASSDWVFNGALTGAPFAREVFGGEAVPSRHYVRVKPGLDHDDVARGLTARLLAYGLDAESFATLIRDDLRQNEGFFTLMQGYLALGLLVGIAGLGVVMVRAVRERRRQIGVLRALGFSHVVVRTAFLLEAAFIAVQGIVLGVGLALIVSYQLLARSGLFGEQSIPFTVPWGSLAVLLVATLAASIVATLAPARQASRIRPAVALRIAD